MNKALLWWENLPDNMKDDIAQNYSNNRDMSDNEILLAYEDYLEFVNTDSSSRFIDIDELVDFNDFN